MAERRADADAVVLTVSRHELVLINNALNEVCHGVAIDDAEFHTRLGGSRQEVQVVLRRVGRLLDDFA
jgi:hypothetical protein